MNSVRAIQQLNKRELESGTPATSSWHTDYRDTAFIYIGGLPFELSEGDIITIFSQYGEPVWIKLARDRETGKSRGFAWIKYEDQRSCDLAVDNMGGSTVMDRVLRVDHARYKQKDDEDMRDNTMGELDLAPEEREDDEMGGKRKRRKTEDDSESEDEERPLLPEEIELGRLMEKLDVDDPMREAMLKSQQEKVNEAVRKMRRRRQKEKEKEKRKERRHRKDDSRERDKDRMKIKEHGEDDDRDEQRRRRRRHSRSRERERDSGERYRHNTSRHRSRSKDKYRREHRDRSENSEDGHRNRQHPDRRRRSRSRDGRKDRLPERSQSPYRRRSPRSYRD